MQKCSVSLAKAPTGLVVRPAAAGSGYETLVFFADEVRTLEGGCEGEPFRLRPQLRLTDGACSADGGGEYALQIAGCPIFEPASGCVFFAEGNAVMRLDSANAVTLAAGSKEQPGSVDGVGEAARFATIRALAAAGRGAVYVAEPKVIRALIPEELAGENAAAAQQASCTVTTLPNTAPGCFEWLHLAYDSAADMMLAATYRAMASVALPGGGRGGGGVRLLAGHWDEYAIKDGDGDVARFFTITGVLAGADHRIHVADYGSLRRVDGHSTVTTVAAGCFTHNGAYPPTYLAILPSGQLAAAVALTASTWSLEIIGGGFAPSSHYSQLLGPPIRERVMKHLMAAPDEGGSSCITGSTVTVRVGGKGFVVHRSLLAHHSDYFKQLFEGGFADSGAAEVDLPDADPDAFAALLGFIYWGVLEVPHHLLRPTAELAGRLLMPDMYKRIAARLLVGCTPATAVSDLLWAEQHSMAVVDELKAYFVRHAKEVVKMDPLMVEQLAATSPQLAAHLICALASRTV